MQKKSIPFSNWHFMIQGLKYSPQDFFSLAETAISEKSIDGLRTSRIKMGEGGMFSAKREYLRVTRKNLNFDICGAPFGNGFFVSWWLGETPSGLLGFLYSIPGLSLLAALYERFVDTQTYFTYDTRVMYQTLIHDAITTCVDQITEEKGVRSLTLDERKPFMKSFFDSA